MDFWLHVLNLIGLFTILGLSLNLLLGYAGLASMAHAAFFGVGAYATALTARDLGLPFPLTMAAA
ncbi:MAG TPA: branched-chain amino acid ABC transporter permease, partial [Methylomirabilota bacterium]|nr:branched-chain amino acid ABC transporter permease [Methylomirabilota bacterium]